MIKLVYIDTSVVGGVFDEEFKLWTNIFFDEVRKRKFKIATSELLFEELERAPEQVRNYIDSLPSEQIKLAIYNDEAKKLADKYITAGIVGKSSLTDCRHIATATVNNIRVVTSWNFKHIVNLDRIQQYNAINIGAGYNQLEIRTPRELLNYEND
jgi:tRNA A37 N6-isopentenylltransferase MiaA